jgi:UDP-glucose:(heptosyl)LPS alpha-1,3-glucosyltransferase
MRVAIVHEHVDVRRGGAESATLELARHLAKLKLDVTVVCAGSDAAPQRPSDERFGLHFINVGGGSRVTRAVRFVAEADRFCRDQRFDIVHAITPCFACNVYQPRGGTYVETVRRSIGRARTPLRRLIKRIGRRFNRRQRFLMLVERALLRDRTPPFVAAISEYVARQVRGAFPAYPSERVRVIFNGVELKPPPPEEVFENRRAVRQELGLDERRPVVLFVAHNFKLKGLTELIGAMALHQPAPQSATLEGTGHARSEPGAPATHAPRQEAAGSSDWVLVVVGRDTPGRYQRLARRLRVAERMHFLGPRDDIRRLYAAADVLAHPTWYDPCSRVVLEALCCGLPVVTTRLNGAAEAIEDGRHGVVIDSPGNTAALADAIAVCLKPEMHEACQAAAATMREHLSMARHARELRALYEHVLAP